MSPITNCPILTGSRYFVPLIGWLSVVTTSDANDKRRSVAPRRGTNVVWPPAVVRFNQAWLRPFIDNRPSRRVVGGPLSPTFHHPRRRTRQTATVHIRQVQRQLNSMCWFSQRRSPTPHFGGAHPGGYDPHIRYRPRFLYNAPTPKFHHPMFTRS